ncbi:hypothetical protein LguiA_020246 [Lonicera macranthoides]
MSQGLVQGRHILPSKGIDVLVDTSYSVGSALIPFVRTRSHLSTILSALGSVQPVRLIRPYIRARVVPPKNFTNFDFLPGESNCYNPPTAHQPQHLHQSILASLFSKTSLLNNNEVKVREEGKAQFFWTTLWVRKVLGRQVIFLTQYATSKSPKLEKANINITTEKLLPSLLGVQGHLHDSTSRGTRM